MTPLVPIAATALGSLANVATSAFAQATRPTPDAAEDSFLKVLETYAGGAVDSLKQSEAAAISGVEGKVSVQKVVDAVMAAERDLHAVIALRDKAVGAYQEISRMAI